VSLSHLIFGELGGVEPEPDLLCGGVKRVRGVDEVAADTAFSSDPRERKRIAEKVHDGEATGKRNSGKLREKNED
jgi:hypothetical protein